MAKLLSIQKPGLLQLANEAKRSLARLHDRLADTTSSSQTTVASDLVDARESVDDIIEDINLLTAS